MPDHEPEDHPERAAGGEAGSHLSRLSHRGTASSAPCRAAFGF